MLGQRFVGCVVPENSTSLLDETGFIEGIPQLWTALIAILLLKYLKMLSAYTQWSLSTLIALLRFNLFTYREPLRMAQDAVQQSTAFAGRRAVVAAGFRTAQRMREGAFSVLVQRKMDFRE